MAEQDSEFFTPEIVDEQIDASLTRPHLAHYPDPSLQVVGALQHHYAATGDHHQPLERVWNRLAQHRVSLPSSQSDVATSYTGQTENTIQHGRRNRMKLAFRGSQAQNTPFRHLSLIAAIVFAILLVGSMFAVLQQARQGQKPIEGHATPTKQPVGSTDTLYLSVNNTIYRYDAATHNQLWSFTMQLPNGANPVLSQGQVVGNVLYALGIDSDGYYSYAINTANGSLRWRYKLDYQSGNLNLLGGQLLANGTVYLSETSGIGGYSIVTALDASTGAVRWKQRYNGTGIVARNQPSDAAAGLTLEAATGDVLYATTFTGKIDSPMTTLFAISATSGSIIWQKQVSTDDEQPDYSGGLVMNGVLCIPASAVNQPGNRHLYGFDATNGTAKWSVPLDGEVSGLTGFNSIVYLGTIHFQTTQDNSVYAASGSVYAVRAADGAQLWRYHAQAGVSSPIVQDGVVSVTVSREDAKREATIVALDSGNGKAHWTYPALANASIEFPASPQIIEGTNSLYVNYFSGQI